MSCIWFTCGPPWRMVTFRPWLRVNAGGERLVVAAIFGLGEPVEAEGDGVLGVCGGGAEQQDRQGSEPSHGGPRFAL